MIYCFLANGFEEVEALTPVDLLRRAEKDVKLIAVGDSEYIEGSHSIIVKCDDIIDNVAFDDSIEAIILPGGMPGTLNLEKNENVQQAIDYCEKNGKLICAICAAPSILGHKGLLDGREAISYPGFEKDLGKAVISQRHVCVDGNYITAKGAGVAVDFGLEIVSYLCSKKTSDDIKASIQCKI